MQYVRYIKIKVKSLDNSEKNKKKQCIAKFSQKIEEAEEEKTNERTKEEEQRYEKP